MAIAFARISYHSRSQGHSAVAGSAYRSGEILLDERTGEVHDFKNRSDVVYEKMLLPDGAHAQFNDRTTLWNAVEAAETRKNSQVAKDVVLALPCDLGLPQQIELANHFAKYHFVRHGVVADIAIHDSGDGNPHAHIYVTTRRLHGDRFDRYKARDLEPDVVRGRVVDPQYWGEQWRHFQNRYFVEQGIDLMVDANHILSQRHEGGIRGDKSHYLKEENQLKREASIAIAVNDPESVLIILGSQHAVFSERDIARLLHKNTDTREAYETALLRLKSHRDLVLLGPGEDGRDRYTTRANYQREALMADQAHALNLRQTHGVNSALVQQSVRDFNLNAEQAEALSHIATSGDICAVVGRAGTGKSYLMKAARQIWQASGYRVSGMAVSGIAAKGLEADSGIQTTTIHALKRQITFGLSLGETDVLVMDEAGMTDLNDMAFMVEAVKAAGAKLVLVGDPAQLQPIGPGAPFRAVAQHIGFSELNHIQRQQDPGDCVASVLLSRGNIDQAIDHYHGKQQVHLVGSEIDLSHDDAVMAPDAGIAQLVADWRQGLGRDTLPERLILAHRNSDVQALNHAARQAMQDQGLLGQSRSVNAVDGPILLARGERIIFLRNHRQMGFSNGEFATVVNVDGDAVTVRVGNKKTREITFSTPAYSHFTYGYAATVHKSQGVTVDHTFVYVAGRAWDRFLAYVAMTRHRKTLQVYADKSQFEDLDGLKSTLSRAVLKDAVLDWPISFAIRRGFDPEGIVGRLIDTLVGIKQFIHDKWLFVTNYAAFKATHLHQKTQQAHLERREMAKKVALFVDLRNGLAAQARLMRQDLSSTKKFHQHPDYTTWFEQTLLKNRLAFEIKQQTPLFENALRFNRIRREALDRLAFEHEKALTIKAYIAHHQKGQRVHCYRLAATIQPDLKRHFTYLAYYSEKNTLSTSVLAHQIKQDAIAYDRLRLVQGLNHEKKRHFRVADRYVQLDRDLRSSVSRAYALGGFDKLSDHEVAILQHQKSTLDRLSFQLVSHPDRYGQALHFYDVDEDKLIDGYQRHVARTRVTQLGDQNLSLSVRDALCSELLADKRYYPLIAEQGVDWKDLRERRDVHQHRETLRSLTAKQRPYYRLVRDYQAARIDAGTAWSALFNDKEKNQGIPVARWQFAVTLSHTRDRLAYAVVAAHPDCLPFITPTRLKLSAIEQHALRYRDRLATLKNSPPKQSRRPRRLKQATQRQPTHPYPEKPFDYAAVNDRLIQMGEDFYVRVLGDHFKRSGNALRFGRKGSVAVTIRGEHAGSWHSFETGEGGGPLQLLMSPTYGWGLSFTDALSEGARLSGLSAVSLEPSRLDTKPPKHLVNTPAPVDDSAEKIARARYYFQSAVSIDNTLGERYLKEHRHLDGDLSAFRFHPRIRDDRVDAEGQHHVRYHPGIMVGAQNHDGEMTAVQTVLLDPSTAHKVAEHAVGAVKRTRGELKGSAVLIHSGRSDKVIIVEGPETAASLIQAEPDAHIYATLGNLKNATELSWLAEKHRTDTFHFAADNDGPHGNNQQALSGVAKIFQEEHQIKSIVSTPDLPDHEKCDFNDVLREKGIDTVRQQFHLHAPVLSQPREKSHLLSREETQGRLEQSVDEWERIKTIKAHAVDRLLLAKLRMDTATKSFDISIQTNGYEKAVKQLIRQEKVFSKVKDIAPTLAETFKGMVQPAKSITIDWRSHEYDREFDKLRESKDVVSQALVKCRDRLLETKDPLKGKFFIKQLNSTAMKFIQYRSKGEEMKKSAPTLFEKISAVSKSLSKEKEISREH